MEGDELIVDGLSRFEAVFSPYQDSFVIIGGAASRIIADTVDAGLIKMTDADMSKKYATYIPYYG